MIIPKRIRNLTYDLLRIFFRIQLRIGANLKYIFLKLRGSNYKNRLNLKSNIEVVLDKIKRNKKKRLALFVAFHAEDDIPLSNIEYLKFLFNCDFDVIYIHNGNLNQKICRQLHDIGVYLITRENVGQDFGAWKDLFSLIYEKKINNLLEWILICNDSNFCIDGGNLAFNDKFKKALDLDNKNDVVSLNLNLGHNLHHQSFFICLSKRIFSAIKFKEFWERYIPLDNRYHIVKNGEMKLSNIILNNYKSRALLRSCDLYQNIVNDHPELNFEQIERLLPKNMVFIGSCFDNISFPSGLLKLFIILDNYNPSHVYALLNSAFNNSPFLKKDLTMSGSYSFLQIHDFLIKYKSISDEILEEIISTLYAKGINYSYDSLVKEATRKGICKSNKLPFNDYIDTFFVGEKQKIKIIEESIKEFF